MISLQLNDNRSIDTPLQLHLDDHRSISTPLSLNVIFSVLLSVVFSVLLSVDFSNSLKRQSLRSTSAYAYEFTGAKWTLGVGQSVPYTVNRTLTSDLRDSDSLSGVQLGFQVWTDVSCSYMSWRFNGRTNNTTWGAGDGENVVSWRENSWDDSATALAITSVIFNFQGLDDTDIKFNGYHHTWGLISEGVGERGATDIAGVSTHEVGHALGLDHSNVSGATMWPSTGPGDDSARSLSQDDISGVCELYPSGGEVPDAPDDVAPQVGSADFGEDCSQEYCAAPYFCVSDGRSQYCTQVCDEDGECPRGYYCAQLSSGSGACALGEPPAIDLAGFNEPCGESIGCETGLFCISDGEVSYCSSSCNSGQCPPDFECVALQGGGDVCARQTDDVLPEFGEPCKEDGRCDEGLFCLNDQLYTDLETGEVIPYCSYSCSNGCPDDYQCAELQPSGDACQKIPSADGRWIGDPCWVNPDNPFNVPQCPDDLRCVNSVRDEATQEWADPGYCTKSCTPEDCCPLDWGCLAITPFLAQCVEGVEDDQEMICMGERPSLIPPKDELGEGEGEEQGGDDIGPLLIQDWEEDGCVNSSQDLGSLWFISLISVLLYLRRRSDTSQPDTSQPNTSQPDTSQRGVL